jgi:hypothetical protein
LQEGLSENSRRDPRGSLGEQGKGCANGVGRPVHSKVNLVVDV